MQLTRGAAALVGAALLLVGVGACGQDAEPDESSTTVSPIVGDSSSSSGSATSSSTSRGTSPADVDLPEDIPAEALENTKDGAAAFGKYYYDTLGTAAHTGETRTLQRLSAKGCEVCVTAIKNITADHEKGWTRSSNPYTFGKTTARQRPDSGYKVSMAVDVAAHQRLDENGEANAEVDATSYTLTEHVVWRNGRWYIHDWVVT